MTRVPSTERATTSASSAMSVGGMSPMGEAVTRLPASVARLRICRDANTRSIFVTPGSDVPSASSRAVSVAAPPTSQRPSTRATRATAPARARS